MAYKIIISPRAQKEIENALIIIVPKRKFLSSLQYTTRTPVVKSGALGDSV